MKSKKIRFSLRTKFIFIFAVILIFTIVGIAVANRILLSRLYESEKKAALISAFKTINGFYGSDDEEHELELEKISSIKDISIYICDEDGGEIFASSRWSEHMPFGIRPTNAKHRIDEGEDPGVRHGNKTGDGNGNGPPPFRQPDAPRQNGFFDGPVLEDVFNGLENGEYVIEKMSDNRLGAAFIQLSAKLDNSSRLYLRTPMEAVDEAAKTANDLLICIGVAALLAGIIIVAFATAAATKPIRQLTSIAGDMADLNFTRRYTGKSSDEVGELGASVNLLSEKLEETISQLKQSNRQLEKDIELKNSVDKMRKEFIANASHELKTPLALISGYAEGLKANIADTPENRNFYCDVIIDEAGKMDKIIKQFLTIAELETENISENEKAEVDLSALVENCIRSFEVLAGQQGVSIDLDCCDGIVVIGSETALYQAVSNYITNALHYVDENRIIKVKLKKNGEKIRFSVYNSGRQIPDDKAEQIWESFGKLDKARTRAYGGSGLGLAIVKKSVELYGGSCGFRNMDGGVEFFFEIKE